MSDLRIWKVALSATAILYVFPLNERQNVLPRPLQEDTLSELVKKTGGFALGALIGKGGSKFGGLDIKRVYFGYVYFSEFSKKLTPCL